VAGALIVTAELGPADFGWLEGLRRGHYPADRNRLSAHLTMFHALPPSAEGELRGRLAELSRQPAPKASVEGLMDLGGGVAFRIVSPGLDLIREELAAAFHGSLGAQDSGGWRPHVTIQNKVPPREARALKESLERGFTPRPLAIHGLGLHRYLGGPWERLGLFPFRGVSLPRPRRCS
jgi:hypothetical protein